MTHPGRRVGVPREGGAARAAARFVLGAVRSDRRIVGLLGLPGDDSVLDVDLPGARPGAVHPVRGPNDLVVAPAVAVEHVSLPTAAACDRAQVTGNLAAGEEPPAADEQFLDPPTGARRGHGPTGRAAGSCACSRTAVYVNATSAVATSSSSP